MSVSIPSCIRFTPVYQTRVWGGRLLETRLGRELPDSEFPYGESWDVSAREEADCEVSAGSLQGKRLSELWSDRTLRSVIFGEKAPESDRFPLLCKILDARERLSIQVHPPAELAKELGGDSKTEVWYIAEAKPGAVLYVGLKGGVDQVAFRRALETGDVEYCVHSLPVSAGQFIFIPSGRLHAIGAGLMIYEIQQNSDTTYRVFDWNRVGIDGRPRTLHIEESLRCIDFSDVEPEMDRIDGNVIVDCEYFRLEKHLIHSGESIAQAIQKRFAILTIISGSVTGADTLMKEGDFAIIPVGSNADLIADGDTEILITTWGGND